MARSVSGDRWVQLSSAVTEKEVDMRRAKVGDRI
jgi:hypothetical protein